MKKRWSASAAMPKEQCSIKHGPWYIKACIQQIMGGLGSCLTPHIAYPLHINPDTYVLPFHTEDPTPHTGDWGASPLVG